MNDFVFARPPRRNPEKPGETRKKNENQEKKTCPHNAGGLVFLQGRPEKPGETRRNPEKKTKH